jgi:hypothetical protein
MPSDALELPTRPELALVPVDETAVQAPELDRSMPAGVQLAPELTLDSPDPAATSSGRRQCVAANKAGARCGVNAIRGLIVCSAHAGRLDSSAGGKAKAEKARAEREEAQNRAIEARLGTRAIIAAALREKAPELRAAIHQLADRAAEGDRQAALAILPFLDQAHGRPGAELPATIPLGDGEELDLRGLDTASLQALLRA